MMLVALDFCAGVESPTKTRKSNWAATNIFWAVLSVCLLFYSISC